MGDLTARLYTATEGILMDTVYDPSHMQPSLTEITPTTQ